MDIEESAHNLMQSYVLERYIVSTTFRQSSAAISNLPWYYETLAWEWNKETDERGKLIGCEGSSSSPTTAIKQHCAVCIKLLAATAKESLQT